MADDLYQLTFVATRRAGAPAAPAAERINLLYQSARGFETLGLTGLLLHHGNRLLYCIEGTEPAVAAQYEKIKADPRVEGVAVLRQREVEGRSFTRWGFAVDDDPRDDQPATLEDRAVALLHGAPPEIRQTFLAFAKLNAPRSPR